MRIYHGTVYYRGKTYATLREALLDSWRTKNEKIQKRKIKL